jgi:hypothetical protein
MREYDGSLAEFVRLETPGLDRFVKFSFAQTGNLLSFSHRQAFRLQAESNVLMFYWPLHRSCGIGRTMEKMLGRGRVFFIRLDLSS